MQLTLNAMNPSCPPAAEAVGAIAVAVMGTGTPAVAALAEALTDPDAAEGSYTLIDVNTVGRPVRADIVVCASAQVAEVAAMVWPEADVVVLIRARDDDTAAIAALDAGATVCVRGTEVGLVAAYVRAIGRRREQTRSEQSGGVS